MYNVHKCIYAFICKKHNFYVFIMTVLFYLFTHKTIFFKHIGRFVFASWIGKIGFLDSKVKLKKGFFYKATIFKQCSSAIRRKRLFFAKVTWYVTAIIFILSVTPLFYNSIIFYKYLARLICTYTFTYLLTTTFIFFNKNLKFGKYTSAVQRFWKRSFALFWSLEIFLFAIVLYLLIFHYSESAYFFDWSILMETYFAYSSFFLIQSCTVLLMLFLTHSLVYSFKYGSTTVFFVTQYLTYSVFLYYVYAEFFKMSAVLGAADIISNSTNYNYKNIFYVTSSYLDSSVRVRTLVHYTSLFVILKFWHIFFIYCYFIYFFNKFSKPDSISYDSLSSLLTNFLFLFYFNCTFFIVYAKHVIVFFFSPCFSWFYINFSNFKLFCIICECFNVVSLYVCRLRNSFNFRKKLSS